MRYENSIEWSKSCLSSWFMAEEKQLSVTQSNHPAYLSRPSIPIHPLQIMDAILHKIINPSFRYEKQTTAKTNCPSNNWKATASSSAPFPGHIYLNTAAKNKTTRWHPLQWRNWAPTIPNHCKRWTQQCLWKVGAREQPGTAGVNWSKRGLWWEWLCCDRKERRKKCSKEVHGTLPDRFTSGCTIKHNWMWVYVCVWLCMFASSRAWCLLEKWIIS